MGSTIDLRIRSPKVSFFTNLGLFIVKLFVALLTNSATVFVESLRSIGDILNSGLAFFGNSIAFSDEDKYSFGKKMYLYTFGFSASTLALGFIAAIGFFEGFNALLNPRVIRNEGIGIIFIVIAMAVDVSIALLAVRELRDYLDLAGYSHPLLKSIVIENVFDVIGEGTAIISLYLSSYERYVDGVSSIFLSVVLTIYMVKLAKENIDVLVYRTAPPDIIARTIKIALSNPSVRDVNSIKTLTIEPNKYAIFMEIELDPNLNLDDIDQTISDIKRDIERYIKNVGYVVIEPRRPDKSMDTHKKLLGDLAKRNKKFVKSL
ncbi:cation diffusion facilitator family transporter [Ignisphaera aggregans DSM 17230]|uniref:Cation diffusion facilitator family transporter n=1 Tax=Ignisphaera aggregans (strain DSM 17230 / JCM 13409 / AQ1.S1) TaxID=583356 RepID=E0SR57_IGNAA|nr:cation diffusion facilitator family transporter [Ignisphaera aggregans DSM 17230]